MDLLSERLEQMFKEKFLDYTSVQTKAIPVVKSGVDTLIIAPTGTGKTEAAILPLLDKVYSSKDLQPLSIIYITPLRALNRDMVDRVREWSERLGLRVAVRHGDTSTKERQFQLKHPPHILITTPETLQSMLGNEKFIPYLRNLRYLIIDELHELVTNKRGAQLSLGITRLREFARFQTVALSATLHDPYSAGQPFLKYGFEVVKDDTVKRIEITVHRVDGSDDLGRLDNLCKKIKEIMGASKTIIFTNTRYMAELIGSRLIAGNVNVLVHHGSLSKEQRELAEDKFKKGEVRALVCTSSLELGIDIGDVDLVVHISSPKQVRKALQRIGRSGHAHTKTSKGIIFSYNQFDYCEAQVIADLSRNNEIEDEQVIYPSRDVLAHAIAGYVLIHKKSTDKEIHDLFSCNSIYSKLSFDDFRLLLSEMHSYRVIFYDGSNVRLTNRTREYYFRRVSTIPSTLKYAMISNGKAIGYLDEKYVFSLNEGDTFIMRGIPWTVLSIEEDRVIVDQSSAFLLAIPEWEGEQIPVNHKVAYRVMEKMGFPNNHIRIDVYAEYMIVYTFLGSSANNALALALANRLKEHFSAEVAVYSSPYAIVFKLPYPLSKESLLGALRGINLSNELISTINNLNTFSYIFSQCAYYLGLSDKHDKFSKYYIAKLSSSQVYKEAFDYFMYKYCDIETAQRFVRELLHEKKIDFSVHKTLPDIAHQVLEHMSGAQIFFPEIPQSAVEVFLGNVPDSYKFRCVNCDTEFYGYTKDLPKKCIKCSSVLLAPVSEKEVHKLSKDELMRRASLYISYGRRALIALSTYGVGTETALRILAKLHKDERILALDLLRAREQFIRTKKYWSV